jgi:putative ABC transport system substrate-binding protein
MRRRDFIAAIAVLAAVWPLPARAQQTMPVIGFLDSRSNQGVAERMRAFHRGLKESDFVEGDNLTVAYRWGEHRMEKLPELAAELVRRNVHVIVTSGGPPSALAAKTATSTIPTVFLVGEDPVRLGLVRSLARPGGNRTGVNLVLNELEGKRLGLLRELLPQATRLAILVNPADATNSATTIREVGAAARAFGMQVQVLNASTPREIEAAFESIGRDRPDALFVGASAFLNVRRVQLVQLAATHRLPAIYGLRESAEAGGLMSYGSDILDAYRQIGAYAGRILKGAKPADLPVVQASKFELVINNATARAQGIAIPTALLALADEVIE